MIIIGERINGTRRRIARAIEARDRGLIVREARRQKEAGADFIDLNAGTGRGSEIDSLRWLVEVAREAGCEDLCLDSARPEALAACLPLVPGRVMLNSINGEKAVMEAMLPLLDGFRGGLVALAMDEQGIPATVGGRLDIAGRIVEAVTARGLARENIYVDLLVQPVGTDPGSGRLFLEAVRALREQLPGVHTTCGLSNVSFGLPARRFLNRCFMAMAVGAGLDSAIIDPTDPGMVATALAAEGLTGADQYCVNYLAAFRAGRVEG